MTRTLILSPSHAPPAPLGVGHRFDSKQIRVDYPTFRYLYVRISVADTLYGVELEPGWAEADWATRVTPIRRVDTLVVPFVTQYNTLEESEALMLWETSLADFLSRDPFGVQGDLEVGQWAVLAARSAPGIAGVRERAGGGERGDRRGGDEGRSQARSRLRAPLPLRLHLRPPLLPRPGIRMGRLFPVPAVPASMREDEGEDGAVSGTGA